MVEEVGFDAGARVPWWREYEGPMVVVGHYWRSRDGRPHGSRGPDLFAGEPATDPLGRGHVMCVDYAVGYRARERHQGVAHRGFLAAYRWPERELVFAD